MGQLVMYPTDYRDTRMDIQPLMDKPFSQACENNKQPILSFLKPHLEECRNVLEIGSGTGQHAAFFAAAMPWLTWQCSDQAGNLPGINMWLAEANLNNTPTPITLDVNQQQWSTDEFDAAYSSNTAHIMHWPEVKRFFSKVGESLSVGGQFFLYGPMNYDGKFSSESNARFDQFLKNQDPEMGIRDLAELQKLATDAGLVFVEDFSMPANNQIIHWQKIEG